MKRGNSIPVLILLIFAVAYGQPKQAKETDEPEPPIWELNALKSDPNANPVDIADSFVQIECNDKEIRLRQCDCGDIGKGSRDFPCYADCVRIKIRTNLGVKLDVKKEKFSNILNKWDAYIRGDDIVDSSGNWNEISVCVEAWKVKLLNEEYVPGNQLKIGQVIVTVKPRV